VVGLLMKIRSAKISDAKVLTCNNILLASESEDMKLDHRTVLKGVKAILSDKQKGFYIVAEDKGTVIGQLMITFEWSDWRGRMIWWLQSVFVEPAWRKKGVFKALLKDIKKRAIKAKVMDLRLYVHTSNKKAMSVYKGTGFSKKPYFIYGFKRE
jgi:GNAT superfamily N-acetyltransferase